MRPTYRPVVGSAAPGGMTAQSDPTQQEPADLGTAGPDAPGRLVPVAERNATTTDLDRGHTPWVAPTARGPVTATVRLPGSKSMTARALILGAVSVGSSTLRAPLRARDTELMAAG